MFYNPTIKDTKNMALMLSTKSGPTKPKNFQAAWNHKDAEEFNKSQGGIKKELHSMSKKGVWKVVKKSNIPDNHHLIRNKWVFKTKKDGVHQARLVALGYSQIPGANYTNNFVPVINDITFPIIPTMALEKGWEAKVVDVEMAFLYGDLEEEIYMKFPEGYENLGTFNNDKCLMLLKALYGLVQAA